MPFQTFLLLSRLRLWIQWFGRCSLQSVSRAAAYGLCRHRANESASTSEISEPSVRLPPQTPRHVAEMHHSVLRIGRGEADAAGTLRGRPAHGIPDALRQAG